MHFRSLSFFFAQKNTVELLLDGDVCLRPHFEGVILTGVAIVIVKTKKNEEIWRLLLQKHHNKSRFL